MRDAQEAVVKFRELLHPFRDIWRSMDARVILCRREGVWWNALTSIRLSPEVPDATRAMNPIELDNFYAGQFDVDIKSLDSVLDDVTKSEATLAMRQVRIAKPSMTSPTDPKAHPQPYNWNVRTLTRDDVPRLLGSVPNFHCFVLEGQGDSLQLCWDHLEWERLESRLLSHDVPFRGIADLARSFIGLPWDVYPGSSAGFRIVAPLYARFEPELEFAGTTFRSRGIGPPTAQSRDLRLATIVRGPGGDRRTVHAFTEGEFSGSAKGLEFSKRVEIGEGQIVELHLLFRGELADTQILVLPSASTDNMRFVTHAHFDSGLERLNQYLFHATETPTTRDTYVIGAAWLLHLCGFQVAYYGIKNLGLKDEIDIIAFVPYSKSVLAVEVTSGFVLNKDKMVKLRARTDELAEVLLGSDVIPVIFTPLEPSYTPESEEAAKLQIAILRPEHLRRLFEMAQQNRSPNEVTEYVKGIRQSWIH